MPFSPKPTLTRQGSDKRFDRASTSDAPQHGSKVVRRSSTGVQAAATHASSAKHRSPERNTSDGRQRSNDRQEKDTFAQGTGWQVSQTNASPGQQCRRLRSQGVDPASQQRTLQETCQQASQADGALDTAVRRRKSNGSPPPHVPQQRWQGQSVAGNTCVVPVSLSDADIRCAATVTVGRSLSVWCGERDGSLAIRDTETQEVRTVLPQEKLMGDFVWSILQEGESVWVGMSSGRLRVYCASTQLLRAERTRHTGGIYALASLHDFVYSASNDFTISEWHRTTWEPTNRILGEHVNQVRSLCVCAGYLVSGGDDHVIHVWEVGTTIRTMCFQRSQSILALASVPGVRNLGVKVTEKTVPDILWAGDSAGELSMYDLQQSKCVVSVQGHEGAVCNLLQQHGFLFSSSVDRTIKVWDPSSRTCMQTLNAHTSYVAGLLPITICTQIRLWSFGGDKKVRSWSMECGCPAVDEFGRLWDESQHQARQVTQLMADCEAAKSALGLKEQELLRLSTDFQSQSDEMENLSAAMAARGEVLAEVLQDLEAARAEKVKLEQEKDDLARKMEQDKMLWQQEKQELCVELEKERCAHKQLASELADANKEIDRKSSEMTALCGKYDVLEQQLTQQLLASQSLEKELTQALESCVRVEQRNRTLEDQLNVQKPLRTSRLGFITEVWGLHKAITEVRSNLPATRGQVFTTSAGKHAAHMSRISSTAVRPEMEVASQGLANVCNHSKMVIAKYLTDDEKLHLGIPLARYEGGHDSPRPLDWHAMSDISTETSLSDECSTVLSSSCESESVTSKPDKTTRQPEAHRNNEVQGKQSHSTKSNSQQAYRPQKRSPRMISASSLVK